MTTTLHNLEDYTAWLTELQGLMITDYGIPKKQAEQYAEAANWEDYYNEEYSPAEALAEDSTYWTE